MSNGAAEQFETSAAQIRYEAAALEMERAEKMAQPSYMLRPRVILDGNLWCALYGDNLQDGVAGFGSTPEKAFAAFDAAWKGQAR
jgi:hypothetical protein